MQPVSFGAMLRIVIKPSKYDSREYQYYYNPQQIIKVVPWGENEAKMYTTESKYHSELDNFKSVDCSAEKLVEALHEAQQTTDKPYIDLVV